ncbi:MAG: hypothetical protein HOG85_03370 [Flavobacteriales bacterium]|jgi:hypothetical protein|nr:hypothetical protein [Flavobacteriales bacterium]
MKTITHKIARILFVFLFISSIFTSCEKEKDTIGIVKVVNSNGNTVQGATVVLNQLNTIPGTDPIDKLRQTAKTDANGKAEFEYTYEAILNIEVDYTNGNDSYTGSGVIRLLRGKIISETVEIN